MIVERMYAEGFLEYAGQTIGFDKGLGEILAVKDIFRDNPDLKNFLENPAIMNREKSELIERVFTEGFSQETRDFLKLLLKKDRIDKFSDIAEYARVKYSHGKEIDAVISASYPLDLDILESLKSVLENKLHKKLHLYSDLDSDLLGGVKVTMDNLVLDGSVKKRLEDMRDKLMAVRID
ncbi:MAG: ATP synthase F1 subunit delta [Candidatus Omnitrophica bacterium]|nr:ATP synthase F1 subunit delta [Candidatus Omnitrophota bacterium]